MVFYGVDHQTIEIKIHNYEFPNTADKEWDGNWLEIYLNVKSNVGHWQTIDPALTTWEVQSIIDWFSLLSKNQTPECKDLGFTEPNLSFELLNKPIDETKRIRIKFNLEFKPQSAEVGKDYFVDIEACNEELKKAALALKCELEKFPERT